VVADDQLLLGRAEELVCSDLLPGVRQVHPEVLQEPKKKERFNVQVLGIGLGDPQVVLTEVRCAERKEWQEGLRIQQAGVAEDVVEEDAHVTILAADARIQELDCAHVNWLHAGDSSLARMAATFLYARCEVAGQPVLQEALPLGIVLDPLEVLLVLSNDLNQVRRVQASPLSSL